MGLWSFLRSLWPWGKRRRSHPVAPAQTPAEQELRAPGEVVAPQAPALDLPPEPVAELPEPPVVEDAPVEAAPPDAAPVEGLAGEVLSGEAEPDVYAWTVPEGADEDEGWEDEDGDDLDIPDPFISGEAADDEPVDLDLEARRTAARAEALEGEQRVYMHMPAGPGSLAEALNQLLAEGLVQAQFVEDADDAPHILYRPVK